MSVVAKDAESSGCTKIMAAGCIPHIVACLRRWPAESEHEVVRWACAALFWIAAYGDQSVKTAVRNCRDVKALLTAALAAGLDGERAAGALKELEFG